MQRTPRPGGGTVADALRATTESAIAMVDDDTWARFHRRRLDQPFAIAEALELFFQELDVDPGDVGPFTAKVLQFFTSSDQRRLGEYEQVSWWDFLGSTDRTRDLRDRATSATRTARAERDPRARMPGERREARHALRLRGKPAEAARGMGAMPPCAGTVLCRIWAAPGEQPERTEPDRRPRRAR